ncbi:hypothetical protein ACJMK2_027967, partial [Sinanodonta woodiana]
GICSSDATTLTLMKPLIKPLAESYLHLFRKAAKDVREFYGLRDFYSLIKMIYSFCEKSKKFPTWHQLLHAIKRNFGGLNSVNPEETFTKKLSAVVKKDAQPQPGDPDCSPTGLIHACFDVNKTQCESRYLLLLTENYGALTILQQQILNIKDAIIIFGSSFPSDQKYTQVCRNINRIKVCMETGNTVVLLNLENLYESLYDALNQYYVYFGGDRYVDLGLGTHRVKCRVHKNFRLIVVAEKDVVYKKFPIPLINRLEKHLLTVNTLLKKEQGQLAERLEKWAHNFSTESTSLNHQSVNNGRSPTQRSVGDVFIGWHTDTYSAIILFVWEDLQTNERKPSNEKVLDESKKLLLWTATPEAVVRLKKCCLPHHEVEAHMKTYWEEQTHDSLAQYLRHRRGLARMKNKDCFAQVTTHSRLLSQSYKEEISRATEIPECRLLIETLQSFDTEQQFSRKIRSFIDEHLEEELLILIQCDSGNTNASLVACARYCILDVHQQMKDRRTAPCHVIFIIQLPRIVGGCFTGFQCGLWHSVHIDDLRVQSIDMPTIQYMMGVSIATLMEKTFTSKASSKVSMKKNKMRDHDAPEEVYSQNACSLIMPSIQSALAMIRDREEATERSTKRVNLVLQLMHKISDEVVPVPSFFQGVTSHLVALMKEKEDKSGFNPSNWLPNEASKPENITKAGTFRRACIQYLESRISPILAGIIAHIDTNQNLDILSGHISQGDWVARLWLHIFNTPAAIQLKYSDLQYPGRQQELSEVIVKTTGCQGLAFQAEFPFSWLMFEQINAISRNTHANLKEKEQTVFVLERIVKIFKETPLGKLLNDFQEHMTSIMHLYTQDFINMTIRVQSDAERELVFKVIWESATEFSAQNPTCVLTGLVSIHEAYQQMAQQLAYFRSINQVWPECSEMLMKLLKEQPNHHLHLINQTLDVQGISLLLDQLNTQDAKYFSDTKGQASWMKKVFCYRPVVEQCLSYYSSHPELKFNPAVVRARQLWIRDMVFKLYIEHIGTMDREAGHFAVKNCMVLWQMLEKIVDLKQVESFKEVEKFLKICMRAAIAAFCKEQPRCPICDCEVLTEGSPVTLPCGDTICFRCFFDDKLLDYNKCRKCQSNIPADFVPDKAIKESKEIKGFKDYQSHCNSFFMDVVSQLCFAENTPPSDEVVDMLLGYITMTTPPGKNRAATKQLTKELTIFNDCFDPTPVFRSFLLQLLLRTSEDMVYSNLDKYLNQAQRVMESTEGLQKEHYNQLCLLVVQCLEDHYHREAMGMDDVEFARDCLQRAGQLIRHDQPSRKLVGIAMTKFGLAVTSKYIHLAVTTASRPNNIWTLCESAVAICKESCHWPKIFFIRYLCRCYGIGSYRTMCQKKDVSFLKELCLENSSKTEVNEASDRYIVCGPVYTRIRDAVTQVKLGEKIEKLNRAVKESTHSDRWNEVFVCLALHREITLDHIRKKSVQKVMTALQNYCKNIKHPMNKEIFQSIIHNTYGKHVALLNVTPGLTIQLQGVLCLLVHCDLILRNLQGDRTLMQPLIKMATHPETLTDPYLPTMPQDNADIRRAILASQSRSHKHATDRSHHHAVLNRCLPDFVSDLDVTKVFDYLPQQNVLNGVTLRDIAEQTTTSDKVRKLFENLQRRGKECYEKFKECLNLSGQSHLRERLEVEEVPGMELNMGTSGRPNSRPNITGNYDPSVQAQTCRECGSLVCRLLPENTPDRQQDMTVPGHILGAASQRAQGAVPEGGMSPAYCAVIRLMLHLSMMLGANRNLEAICQLIKPKIAADGVDSFLMDYIQRDLNDLHQTLGKSVDDVFVMMHYILNKIMLEHDEKEQLQEEICDLRTKTAKLEWEKKFSERFLAPVLQTLDAVLQEMNQNLARDKRPGSDPLLGHLFETNTSQETFAPTELQEDPSMWYYRTRITIDHLRHEFDVQMTASNMNQNQYRVLHLFLREEHHLRALRFIPSILKLHRILFQKFQRQLGRAEASSMTVDSVIKEDWGKDLKDLIQDYANAWELVRNSLSMTTHVLQDYCRKRIDGSTPISQLLPSSSGAGLCTWSLMWFLLKKQNDFLDEYCKMRKSSSTENLPEVKVRELTPAHLISYHPEQDILPLVLANCNYSFKMAKGTTIEYNFANLERQITDRFIFGKSLIDIEIEEMVYRADFTNAATFRKLEEKIPQEPLNSGVKHKISEEFRSLPDLCQALDNLDIAISFLKSIGGNPGNNLDKFMVETLKMEQSLHNASAKLYCQYRHVKSLWLLLSLELEKSKILAKHNEMIFDGIPEDFHQPLAEEDRKALKEYLQHLPLKCLIPLLELMFECIVLFISVPHNPDNKDFTKERRFGDYLQELFDDREMEVDIQLQKFPPEVLSKCCVSAWELTYTILRDKEKSGHRH